MKGLGQQNHVEQGVRLPLRPGRRPPPLIDHPSELPLRVHALTRCPTRLQDPGLGGVRFSAQQAIAPGTLVELSTLLNGERIALRGVIVAWTRQGPEIQLEMAFLDPQAAFEGRMLEQACHIEAYRLRTAARGRSITLEEAAREWITHHSAAFPAPGWVS
ncbi:MAG TPA: hypothetical protein ENK62_03220 [Chromatiales bacterium]|nr:hypothetical protein [Chromatiales bacterium]